MHAANELIDDERYDAFEQIEHDLVRDAAPCGVHAALQQPLLVLAADGVPHYLTVYGIDLAQLCLRPEITTDDAVTSEPGSGTTAVHVPVRLSSEMENTVTVDYATADGTAHAGETTSPHPER